MFQREEAPPQANTVRSTMYPPPSDTRDLWLMNSRDCSHDPGELSYDRARFILAVHAGHGGGCRQYLAASAYCFRRTEEK